MKQTNKPGKEQSKETARRITNNTVEVTSNGLCLEQKRELSAKELRQREFLRAYCSNNYNVAAACRSIRLNSKQFYRWKKSDPSFVENLKISQDELTDYLKSKLLKLVDEGNLIATIFACKSLGKMVETTRQDITLSKGIDLSQEQLDACVRGASIDRDKYEKMLGL